MSGPGTTSRWQELLDGKSRDQLSERLINYARQRRWFRGKSRSVSGARISDVLPLDADTIDDAADVLVVVEVRYAQGEPDHYVIPMAWSTPDQLASLREKFPHTLVSTEDGLVDGLATGSAAVALLDVANGNLTRRGQSGKLAGEGSDQLARAVPAGGAAALKLKVAGVEQTNSTVMFGDRALLKVYRQPSAGPNVELEMGRFLDRACDPPCVPRVLGAMTYQPDDGPARSLGVIHELIANRGDAWALAQRELESFFQSASDTPPPIPLARGGDAWLAAVKDQAAAQDSRAGRFVALATVLGRRTGELHVALAGRARPVADAGPDFAPEPLTAGDRRALADRTQAMLDETLASLSAGSRELRGATRTLAERVLAPAGRQAVGRLLADFRDQPIETVKIRTHGDLHLGQVLAVARREGAPADDQGIDDFVIIDFEGEPARPLHERRAKGSPLRDVMGMVRSFDYAPEAALRQSRASGPDASGGGDQAGWARLWTRQVTASYLRAYLDSVAGAPFVPADRGQLARLLTYYELEKVVYEVGYELNNRPDWLNIPLRGLLAVAGLESGT